MSQTIRTFIAAPIILPDPLRSILRRLREMGRAVKAVDPENPHITVKFLGDTSPEHVSEVTERFEAVLGGVDAFEIELAGIGAFPHWKRPMVTWAGAIDAEPLTEIANRLENELEPLGFPKERRAYHPHLTLARIKAKPPPELHEIAQAHETTSFGQQKIDRLVLFQSELQKTGAVYTLLKTVTLQPRD